MGATIVQILCLLLAFLGVVLTSVSMTSNEWRISSPSGSLITTIWIYDGLWKTCSANAMGIVQCTQYSSLLSLHSYIQACRALMIIAIILGVIATMMALVGLKCTNIGTMDEKTKGKVSLTAGLIFILSGLCGMVPISWYAYNITMEFYNPVFAGSKYELGSALYIGWAGSALLILGGSFLCCSCKRNAQPGGYKYSSAQSGQRIYTKAESTQSKAYV
ncbi:claudin-15-like isoform X1 [Scyliorhinus canicula]|uniref:claudin-15-like isoform X1 n=1 Tax=Scyliorhinus canicula TaxID=7830 RepID=UPI0018F677BB|nr:claudin-15-like isoform X1 [Scyliorhinus canicula]